MTAGSTMRVAALHEYGKPLRLEQWLVPRPGVDQVLVKVAACGVCHTDLHICDGEWGRRALPLVPGHEITGHVAAVGRGVTGLREGEAVGVPWLHHACGSCEHCRAGWENYCGVQVATGLAVHGGFAQYVLARAGFVSRLPAGLPFAAAAPVLCAGVTALRGFKQLDSRPGQWVAVSGVGGLGHIAVQYARAMGRQVLALDIDAEKLALARALGADVALDARAPDVIEQARRLTGGGAHGVLITAASTAAFSQGVALLRRRGTMVLIGLPAGRFDVAIMDMVGEGKTIRGSAVGTREDVEQALALATDGSVAARFECMPLDQVNDAMQRLRAGSVSGRLVLSMQE
jgi:propanol-preferring alcohol dehydrogenase